MYVGLRYLTFNTMVWIAAHRSNKNGDASVVLFHDLPRLSVLKRSFTSCNGYNSTFFGWILKYFQPFQNCESVCFSVEFCWQRFHASRLIILSSVLASMSCHRVSSMEIEFGIIFHFQSLFLNFVCYNS